MKLLLLTNEYPPYIYGGAGVHVANLSRELAKLCQVEVRCFGDQDNRQANLKVTGYQNSTEHYSIPDGHNRVFDALQRCLHFNTDKVDADIIHVHTWYTHWGGILAKLNYAIPLVVTVHSLEPLRPWKREQLGGGYDFTSWLEKTALEMADAIIAVSEDTKKDILRFSRVPESKIHVIPNGINPQIYKPVQAPSTLTRFGINPAQPFVLFVGRITRQKGILHLVNAIPFMKKNFQIVLCAGSPDTPDISREMVALVKQAQALHPGVIWIKDMISEEEKVALYSHAAVFCCPSVYEPFGIINLEAMACATPVVASAVGGIKEVVEDKKTGLLVPVRLRKNSHLEPTNPKEFSRHLAVNINQLMDNDTLRSRYGKAGRQRVLQYFTWEKVARKTLALYKKL
jgi:glycogen synthase